MSLSLQTKTQSSIICCDETLIVPIGKNLTSNTNRTKTPTIGSIAYNQTDSSLYVGGNNTWTQIGSGSGSGDVTGPANSIDNALTRFNSTTGKLIQSSSILLDDSGNLTGVTSINGQSLGTGDVNGPVSSTNNAITRYDLTTGKLIKNSLVLIDDLGNLTGVNSINGNIIGTGDVNGPVTSVDNALVRFDTTTGKLIQNSSIILDDSGNLSGVTTINGNSVGNVVGPVNSTNNALVRYDTTSGKLVKNSTTILDDSGNLSGVLTLNSRIIADTNGPLSSTDNAIARFDTTTGKLLQNSVVLISDTGAITGVTTINGNSITTGDVIGPISSTDNALVRFDTTSGKLLQNSTTILDDSGNLTGVTTINSRIVADVNGPISSTDNALVRFDTTTGKLLQNSTTILDDSGNLTGVTSINGGGVGNVIGPINSTDNAIVRYDTTSGKLVQNSSVLISDTGDITGIQSLNGQTVASGTNTGDVTLATFGATPSAVGCSLSGQILTLQPASSTFPGGVSTLAQTYSGVKTFANSIILPTLNTTGIVHNNTSGILSTSLIVDADITNLTITDSKLAVISATGKVLNSATTATSVNSPLTIVSRDGSGNFEVNQITINGSVNNPSDVATKDYVDSTVSSGLVAKNPAIVISVTNITLSGIQTIDGILLTATDRVLANGQTTPSQNGLWVVQVGIWTRPTDFTTGSTAGQAYVLIIQGTLNGGSSWLCSTPTAIVDTDPINFVQFSLPNQLTGVNVGTGSGQVFKNKTGNSLNFKTILQGTHLTVTNNTNDITITTDSTNLNIPSTIVARDNFGNFTADTITANLIGNVTGDLTGNSTTSTTSTLFSGSLAGDVTGTQSATVVSLVGGVSNTLIAAGATLANNSTDLNNVSTIVRRDGSGNFTANTITSNLIGNVTGNSTTSTTSTNFSGSLVGDVTGTQGATIVSLVGGQTATAVAAGSILANNSTNLNTFGTIVRRDGSGNFTANTITSNLIGNVTGNATTSTTSTNFSGSLVGDVTGTQSATVVSVIGGQTSTNVAAGVVLANNSTNLNTNSTIVRRDGSGNFTATNITANLIGNATTSTTSTNFSGSLFGDVTGTQGASVVSLVGGQTSSSVATGVVLANNSTNLNTNSTIVRRDGLGNFAATTITANLVGNVTGNTTTSTTSTNFSGSLVGDVTGTQGATIVGLVGGQSSTNVASGVVLANNSTNLNTNSTIVRRDGSGNFTATTITANLVGNVTGNATTSTTSTNFSGSLVGDVTGTQGATIVSLVGGQTSANIATGSVLANNSTTLNTFGTIVRRDGSGNFAATTITSNLIGNVTGNATTSTTSTNFSGSLVGDVTGTQGATIVSLVGGQSSTNVASGSVLANNSTNFNTFGTIVRRDGSGNFTATTITANLTGNVTGNATTSTSATSFSGSLVGDVTGTQGATIVSLVGGQTSSSVASATILTLAATNINTNSAIVKRDSSGNFDGSIITAVNYVASGTINLVNTTTNITGIINKGGSRFLHNYGTNNLFLGPSAGNFTLTGARCIGIGASSLAALTSGIDNVGFGYQALQSVQVGNYNTATGSLTLRLLSSGDNCSGFGYQALTSNTSGDGCSAFGSGALMANTSGINNCGFGLSALRSITSFSNCTAMGVSCLELNTADSMTAFGAFALGNNVAAVRSTAMGVSALGMSNANDCTAFGFQALASSTGLNNIAFGSSAGANIIATSNNIDIGNQGVLGDAGTIRFGTTGTHVKNFQAGIRGITADASDGYPVYVSSTGQLTGINNKAAGTISSTLAGTIAVPAGAWILLTTMTISNLLSNFTRPADNRLQYVGTATVNILASAMVTLSSSATTGIYIAISKNGASPASVVATQGPITATSGVNLGFNPSATFSMATNDYISIWTYAFSATNLTIASSSLSAIS